MSFNAYPVVAVALAGHLDISELTSQMQKKNLKHTIGMTSEYLVSEARKELHTF